MSGRGAVAAGDWTVGAEAAGERLDRALSARLGVARSRVRSWIEQGSVRIGDSPARKAGEPLRPGDRVRWEPPPEVDDRVQPEPGPLVLLWSDDDLLVLDKPADLVVHPGAGRRTGTLAHRLLAAYPELAGVGGPGRPGIVHRLDRGTTGCLVVARHRAAHEALAKSFAGRVVDKRYLGVVWGRPQQTFGVVDAPVGRHPVDRQRMAVRPRGRPALTRWCTLASAGPVSLLELDLATGRTHQIRVHLKHLGHPLVGDPVYGAPRRRDVRDGTPRPLEGFPRPALHAWRIALPHPADGRRIACTAPVPDDLRELWRAATGASFPDVDARSDDGGRERPPSRK